MKKLLSIFVLILASVTLNATPIDCNAPISSKDFQAEIIKIKAHDFDEAKKEATEKLLMGKCFTSAQVKMLLENLSFEEHKLELAKKAYAHVTDKKNYGIISSIFEFDDAKDELVAFIKNN
jgi:hypothetical protein